MKKSKPKSIKYPRLDNRPMDPRRRKAFNLWRETIRRMIINALERSQEPLSDETIDTIAWNVAFTVVAAEVLP